MTTPPELADEAGVGAAGCGMYALIEELYPVCRSLTGDGVRRTLAVLGREAGVGIHEVSTGTRVFDWTVPREWNIRDAWVEGPDGQRVVDYRDSNLHVVGYSVPVDATMSLEELRPHLHSLPEWPDRIPYRTSYYAETWGFCLAHDRLTRLSDGEYRVRIDSTLEEGHLTYGELLLEGESDDEILVHTHVCHPSMCNDNLSGIAVATWLAKALAGRPRRFGYRFLFLPGTIGAITWLADHESVLPRVRGGLVLSNLGDPGPLTYKKSRRDVSSVDRAAALVLRDRGAGDRIEDFVPYGYDERQYCSPGIDLAVGSLSRTPWGRYDEYHTSADDPDFVRPEALEDSLAACLEILEILEGDGRFRNLEPRGEPQLGRRGLYGSLGGRTDGKERELALLWVLNQSDGDHTLLDVAERSGLPFARVREAADRLLEVGLLEELESGGPGAGER